jgi:PAS domain S-box-containing protein
MPERSKQGSLSGHRQNETWLREQALAASRDALVITDPNELDNPIIYANPAFERITGYSAEGAIGKNCRFLQGEDRDQPALEELRAAVKERRECQVILRNYTKDGTLFWNELSISPVNDEEGNLANFFGVLADVTERKRTEEALQYQLDLVRAITDNAADSLFLWDTEGRVTFMNPAAEQTFGWRQEELLGEVLHDKMHHHHPDGRPYPISECPLVRVFESAQTLHDHEDVFFHRDGSPMDVACSLAPIVVDGKITGATLVVRDITERKKNEEAVRQSELLYQTVIEQATENIFLVEVETRCIAESNHTFQETLGYTDAELRSMTLYDIVAADPKSIDINIRHIVEQTDPFVGERRYRRKDGSLVDVEVSASIILRQGKETLCVVAHDVTERKRAEQESSRLAAIVDSSDDAIIGKTLDGIVTTWNRGAQQIYGYSVEEIVGKPISVLAPPDRYNEILGILEKVRCGAPVNHYETVRRKKDGERINVSLTVSPIVDSSGNVVGASTIARDITERKRVEEAQHFLAKAGTTLSSSLDYPTTLASAANLAVPYLADWCLIDVLEEDGSLDRLAMTHQDPEKIALAHELEERYPPDPDAPRGVTQVLRTGHSELVPEMPEPLIEEAAHDAEHREILRRLGLKSYMIVPLVARGRTLGAITLVLAESGRRYGRAELELAEELARRAALAVDNARLYRGRIEIARTLQEGLLPSRLPEVPGVEVGLRYLSAGDGDVGGDFYDLFETSIVDQNSSSDPSSSWGVVLGDVSGKGAEAAAVLALARYTIRAVAMRELHPSAVLTGLNEAMLRQRREHEDHKFCTVIYAKLETNEGNIERGAKVTVCRGGHAPPYLLKADGSIHKIGQPGPAMGIFDDATLAEQEANLASGDALVLYTDGVVEARSPDGLFFGEERLMALLRSSVALDASTIASRIEGAVLSFQEQVPRDDIAVLVLRVSD